MSVSIGAFRVVVRLIYAVIRNGIHRSFPAHRPDRLLPDKGNTPVHDNILSFPADKGPVYALDCKRLVIIAAGNPFVLAAILLPQQLFYVIQCLRLLSCITHCFIRLLWFVDFFAVRDSCYDICLHDLKNRQT